MAWYVYILRCGDGTLYTGITDNVERRLAVHRAGRGAKYTRGRGPLELAYEEEQPDKSSALKRELAIKKMRREEKEALCRAWAGETGAQKKAEPSMLDGSGRERFRAR